MRKQFRDSVPTFKKGGEVSSIHVHFSDSSHKNLNKKHNTHLMKDRAQSDSPFFTGNPNRAETVAETNNITKKPNTPAEQLYLGKPNARRVKTGGYLDSEIKIRNAERKLMYARDRVEKNDHNHRNTKTNPAPKYKKGESVEPEHHFFGLSVGGIRSGLNKLARGIGTAYAGYKASSGDQNAMNFLKAQASSNSMPTQQPQPSQPQTAKKGKLIINIKHPGALHEKLGVSRNEKIPEKLLKKATKSSNPTLKKEAIFAQNAKHWNHSKG